RKYRHERRLGREGLGPDRLERYQMNRHSILRDGIVAGFLGATAVALLFLFVDLFAGRPFYTPLGLGRGLISVLGPGHIDAPAVVITVYPIFHYLAFMAVASLAALI